MYVCMYAKVCSVGPKLHYYVYMYVCMVRFVKYAWIGLVVSMVRLGVYHNPHDYQCMNECMDGRMVKLVV